MGEAGAYPNAGVAISRWFPPARRTSAWGIGSMASQLGGALAPLLVVPIQMRYGWRASFYVFGLLGVAWAIVWFRWFRDCPAEMPNVSPQEIAEIGVSTRSHRALPWTIGIRSINLWSVMTMAGSYGYTLYFSVMVSNLSRKGARLQRNRTSVIVSTLPGRRCCEWLRRFHK